MIGYAWPGESPPVAATRIGNEQGVAAAREFWAGHRLFASLNDVPEARALTDQMLQDYSGWHWAAPGRKAQIAPTGPLQEIATPTLVISGGRDEDGYRAIAAQLTDTLPDARLCPIASGGHMINLDSSAAFNAALHDFDNPLSAKRTAPDERPNPLYP